MDIDYYELRIISINIIYISSHKIPLKKSTYSHASPLFFSLFHQVCATFERPTPGGPRVATRGHRRTMAHLQILQGQASVLRGGLLSLQGVLRPDALGIHELGLPGLDLKKGTNGCRKAHWKI